jgi:hypothetical protein
MKNQAWLAVVAAVAIAGLGCNVPSEDPNAQTTELGTLAQALDGGSGCSTTYPPTLPLPYSTPVDLNSYRWGTPFYPTTAQSMYTVYTQHPTDPTRFLVYAIDMKGSRIYFFGSGVLASSHLSMVLWNHGRDLEAGVIRNPTSNLGNGTLGIPKDPIGPVGPGTPPFIKAQHAAYDMQLAYETLVAP